MQDVSLLKVGLLHQRMHEGKPNEVLSSTGAISTRLEVGLTMDSQLTPKETFVDDCCTATALNYRNGWPIDTECHVPLTADFVAARPSISKGWKYNSVMVVLLTSRPVSYGLNKCTCSFA